MLSIESRAAPIFKERERILALKKFLDVQKLKKAKSLWLSEKDEGSSSDSHNVLHVKHSVGLRNRERCREVETFQCFIPSVCAKAGSSFRFVFDQKRRVSCGLFIKMDAVTWSGKWSQTAEVPENNSATPLVTKKSVSIQVYEKETLLITLDIFFVCKHFPEEFVVSVASFDSFSNTAWCSFSK